MTKEPKSVNNNNLESNEADKDRSRSTSTSVTAATQQIIPEYHPPYLSQIRTASTVAKCERKSETKIGNDSSRENGSKKAKEQEAENQKSATDASALSFIH